MTDTATSGLLDQRRSTRAYLSDPVPKDTVAHILRAARKAPSSANLQPGRFHALGGVALTGLSEVIIQAIDAGRPQVAEYTYFPRRMPSELQAKRRAAGYALYDALGIEKRDLEARTSQFKKNYRFFDAPVGIVVTIHKDLGQGCFMDLGMAVMALMLEAQELGYATCGIGALGNYGDLVHDHLKLNSDELVICGIALGKANLAAPENQFETERDSLETFASFQGFDT